MTDDAAMCRDLDILRAGLAGLITDPTMIAARRISPSDIAGLTPSERASVAAAVPSRQAEFATGRALLRSLIGERAEILRTSSGSPMLPLGWSGSLAHDAEYAIAVVSRSEVAVGIDIEPRVAMESDVAELIVRADDVVPDALTAFVVKEAVYKAWSTAGGVLIDHQAVRVVAADDRFTAEAPDGASFTGTITTATARIMAVAVSRAS